MSSWNALLGLVSGVFTCPSFALFSELVQGWVCAPGRRTITGMITVADPTGRRAHDAYHRLLRDGVWAMSRLWKILTCHLVNTVGSDGVLELACDDTLFHHEGRRIDGAGTFRDAVRSTLGKVVYARGLNLVVITLQVRPPWAQAAIAVPINMRLHRKNDATTTLGHAQAMITEIAGWLPGRRLHLVADGAYAPLAGTALAGTHLSSRMRRNAALYTPAPPPTGKRGRPRTKGDRLPTPQQLSQTLPKKAWTKISACYRGRTTTLLVHTRDVLWYHVNKTDLVRLVIVRDPHGTQPDDYFVTTDLDTSAADTIRRYADRWSIEICFRDTKQNLGGQQPQSWQRHGPERAAALSLWLHAAIWCCYIHDHPAGDTWTPRPWYTTKSTPSFLDALATLRRALWSQRITATSAPPAEQAKITETILDTLAYAA